MVSEDTKLLSMSQQNAQMCSREKKKMNRQPASQDQVHVDSLMRMFSTH